jgi:hypothetical protein
MKYVLMYAKIVDDKEIGSLMTGVHFGGVFDTEIEADAMARDCVTNAHSGTIIPKVFKMGDEKLEDIISHAMGIFDRMADNIYESEKIIKNR